MSSDFEQNRQQMLHRDLPGLIDIETLTRATQKINNRPLLKNEFLIDIAGKTPDIVFEEATTIIDTANIQLEYDYQPPPKNAFDSWVQINRRS